MSSPRPSESSPGRPLASGSSHTAGPRSSGQTTLPVPPPRGLAGRLRLIVDGIIERSRQQTLPGARIVSPLYVLRVLVQVFRQWARDRCPQQAASLAYTTA